MDTIYHKLHRKKRGRPGQLHWQISSPGKRVAVRVAFKVTGRGQEKAVCRRPRAPWSNLRSFHCRKPQRGEHGGQVFVVQVEGSLFSYQHNSKMRFAHKVRQILKPLWTNLTGTWCWCFKTIFSFFYPFFNSKVLLFYSNELSLIPFNLARKAGKYLILFVIWSWSPVFFFLHPLKILRLQYGDYIKISFYKVSKCVKPLKPYLMFPFSFAKLADQSSLKAAFCCKSYTLQSNFSTTFTLETEFAGRCIQTLPSPHACSLCSYLELTFWEGHASSSYSVIFQTHFDEKMIFSNLRLFHWKS